MVGWIGVMRNWIGSRGVVQWNCVGWGMVCGLCVEMGWVLMWWGLGGIGDGRGGW